jgi:aldehyde dehydrogenase (NAD+)
MTQFTSSHFLQMQHYFFSRVTTGYRFRKQQLQTLKKAVQKYEAAITEALFKDLHKSREEAFTTEIGFVYAEISHTLKNLESWMEPICVRSPMIVFPSASKVLREPLGICLVIAPWNYPFQLLIAPLIGAIAGGNCAVLKPSEFTVNTSRVIDEMITEFFDKQYVCVVEGDGAVVVPQMMNENRFDHVFFTGSIPVGKEIAKLAAPKLVPTALELGGKSPCIVDEDVDITVAAKRITWGKFTNAGQTCVAPDYLLVHEKRKDQLVELIQENILKFYGENPQQSYDYGRIINSRRLEKLESYLNDGRVITGGKVIKDELYFSPTLLENVALKAPVMKEEIFGPILPIHTFKQHEEAINIINHNPHPLSLYFFGYNNKAEKLYMNSVAFGGGCVNNTLVHLANADLPFGGVGNSGVGAYHGKFSFETFTRSKAILKTATWLDPALKYPPYKGKLKWLRWFFR